MLQNEKQFKDQVVEQIAQEMSLAARTAPKAKGLDLLEIIVIKGETIKKLSDKMKQIGEKEKHQTFIRDGGNVLNASAIVIIGTKRENLNLKYCGLCGFGTCAGNDKAGGICAFNTGDLGIAVGSAVAVAADHRIDNRIMYTVGKAAIDAGLMDKDICVAYGIPLSATGKNPFFDRR